MRASFATIVLLLTACGAESGVLAGRTVLPDGTGRAARIVVFLAPPGGDAFAVLAAADTAHDGTFRLPVPAGRLVAVRAEAEGLAGAPFSAWPERSGDFLVLVLRPAPAVEVRVRDEAGAPVAGAGVELVEWCGASDWKGLGYEDRPVARGTTGPDGACRLPPVVPRVAKVVIRAEGYVPRREDVAQSGFCESCLERGQPLRGRVLGFDGKPEAGAMVRALSGPLVLAETRADAEGRFLLPAVPEEDLFEVEADAGPRGRVLLDDLRWGPDADLELALEKVRAISGRVLRYAPVGPLTPVASVRLEVGGGDRTVRIASGPDGGFAAEGLGYGSAEIRLSDERFAFPGGSHQPRTMPVGVTATVADVVVRPAPPTALIRRLDPDPDPRERSRSAGRAPRGEFEVSGRVLDGEGRGVAGVGIYKKVDPFYDAEARTDLGGRFRCGFRHPGTVALLRAAHPRWRIAPLSSVPGGATDLVFRAERGETIAGRILDAAGNPVPGQRVEAVPDPGPAELQPTFARIESAEAHWAWSDADGRFVLSGLTGRLFAVGTTARSWEYYMSPGLRGVPAGATDLTLTATADFFECPWSLWGEVRGPDGPVEGARVRVEPEGFRGPARELVSADNGRYYACFSPGPHTVSVFIDGRRRDRRLHVLPNAEVNFSLSR